MIIQHVTIDHVLGIRRLDLDLTTAPVHVIGGPNASGKTSIVDALRFLLVGDAARVSLKKDYSSLVTEGATSGSICASVKFPGQDSLIEVCRAVPGEKKHRESDFPALPYVIDAHCFADSSPDDRRRFLRGLMGVRITREQIAGRMWERGCLRRMIDEILPMLRADRGFDDAHQYAKTKQSEARGAWKAATGGETYGLKKADGWRPIVEEVAEGARDNALDEFAEVDLRIVAVKEEITEARMAAASLECPHCGKRVRHEREQNSTGYRLVKYASPMASDPEAPTVETLSAELQKLEATRGVIRAQLDELDRKERAMRSAEDVARIAQEHHKEVQAWGVVADALSPSGIPGELLGEILGPINDKLCETASRAGWQQPRIDADMAITANGRPYALLSESEQWRASAQIANAITSLSGLGLLILDRLDVLQKSERRNALKWLVSLGNQTTIVLGTMEAGPIGMKGGIMFHQLENGRLKEV